MTDQEKREKLEFRLNLVAFEFQDLDLEDARAILEKVWASWKRHETLARRPVPIREELPRAS
jgi:hypothetical protein